MTQPQHAVPSFGILGINNNNPCHTGNATSKPREGTGPGQVVPIPVTNPTNRVSWCRGEAGKGEQRKQPTSSTKKARTTFSGDGAHSPHHADEADKTVPVRTTMILQTLMMTTYSWTLCKIHKMGRKQRRGRNACNSSVAKKHRDSNPYCPGCCGTYSSVPPPQLP